MVLAVVSFEKENTVEVVPTSWFSRESKECFWPPKTINKFKLVKMINNLVQPYSDWECHRASLLGEYDSLEVAKKKAQKAEFTSDLSSASDAAICLTQNKPCNENDGAKKSIDKNMAGSSPGLFHEQPVIPSCSRTKTPIEADLLATCRRVNLSEDRLITKAPNLDQPRQNFEQFYAQIPVKNEEGLIELEEWLKDRSNYQIVVTELSWIGGTTVAQTTRKMLYKTCSNALTIMFSWEGMKGKKAFKKMLLSKCILETMRICFLQSSEAEVIAVMKAWLVKAKERMKNKNTEPEN